MESLFVSMRDLYEATMPRDFTCQLLKTKDSLILRRKMLLTGKEACYVLDTVDDLS